MKPHLPPATRPLLLCSALTALLLVAGIATATPAVQVDGVDGDLAQAAIAAASPSFDCQSPRWVVLNQGRRVANQVRRRLRAAGHYSPTVDSRVDGEPTASTDGACWSLQLAVDPGPVTRVRNVDLRLEDASPPSLQALLDARTPTPGVPFIEADWERLKQALGSAALAAGYLDARFSTARVDVHPQAAAADLQLVFALGRQHQFGAIRVEPADLPLREDLVTRLVGLQQGDPFDAGVLSAAQQRLWESGFFRSVDVRAAFEETTDRQVPVVVHLSLQTRHALAGGVGFATDIGPRLRSEYSNRRVNSRGHQSSAQLQISPVVSEVHTEYRLPLSGPREAWLNFDLGVKREDTDTSRSEAITAGVRRVLDLGGGWKRTEFIDLNLENFRISNDQRTARLLMPGVRLIHAALQTSGLHETGHRVEVELRGASEALGSSTRFAQLYARGVWATALGERWRLLVRGELGTTAQTRFASLPPSVRFFAGGDNSVRGYDFERLGPRDENGEVIGGSHLFTAATELEYRFRQSWSVAAFSDAGNAFDDWGGADLFRSVGLGVRWHSPVGAIRLDLAHPLDDSRLLRLHLGVGRLF